MEFMLRFTISHPDMHMTTVMRPEMKYPMCAAWQLSVPAIGFTCSDHFHPGSNVARPTGPDSRFTSSSMPFPSLKGRVSSGESRLLRINPAIVVASFSVVYSEITCSSGMRRRLNASRQLRPKSVVGHLVRRVLHDVRELPTGDRERERLVL